MRIMTEQEAGPMWNHQINQEEYITALKDPTRDVVIAGWVGRDSGMFRIPFMWKVVESTKGAYGKVQQAELLVVPRGQVLAPNGYTEP
jgi:hypothetical protein